MKRFENLKCITFCSSLRPKQGDSIKQQRKGDKCHVGTGCNKILKLSATEQRRKKVNKCQESNAQVLYGAFSSAGEEIQPR